MQTLLSDGMLCDPMPVVVAAERLQPRGHGPGMIKVEFGTVQDKVVVLRRKQNLKESERYGTM